MGRKALEMNHLYGSLSTGMRDIKFVVTSPEPLRYALAEVMCKELWFNQYES